MASRVVSSVDFDQLVDTGQLIPNHFKYRFLVEGDSWMDRSSPIKPSLLERLPPEFDARHEDALFINLSHFGDTMRRIRECMGREFKLWLRTQFSWKFDAILLIMGGLDGQHLQRCRKHSRRLDGRPPQRACRPHGWKTDPRR